LLAGWAGVCQAEEGTKPKPERAALGERIFGRFDPDGDGKVALADLPAPLAAKLGSADKDNDGSVTKEEWSASGLAGKGEPKKPAPPDGRDPAKMLQKLDANGDGKLEGNEIPERMRDKIAKIDTNGNGAIEATELEAMTARMAAKKPPAEEPRRPLPGAMIEQLRVLDLEGTGKILIADMPATAQRFAQRLDTDKDGYVSLDELKKGAPTGRPESGLSALDLSAGPEALFKNFDGNSDGKLSKEELTAMPNLPVGMLDTNADGDLTREELDQSWTKLQARIESFRGKRPRGPADQVGARQLFHQQDADADGRLTKEEAKGTLANQFDSLDTNTDGKLDAQEVEKGFIPDDNPRPKKKNKPKKTEV
jgi:Ca2+-binding EF-hand superfamily protein